MSRFLFIFSFILTIAFGASAQPVDTSSCLKNKAMAPLMGTLQAKLKGINLQVEARQNNLKEVVATSFWAKALAYGSSLMFALSLSVLAALLVVLSFNRFFSQPTPQNQITVYALSLFIFHVYLLGALVGIFMAGKPSQEMVSEFKYVASSLVQIPSTANSQQALNWVQKNRQELLKIYHRMDPMRGPERSLGLAFGWDESHYVEFEQTLVETLLRFDQLEARLLPSALAELGAQCQTPTI